MILYYNLLNLFNNILLFFFLYRDGKVMVLGCRPNHLALFLLANFKLLKFITLPEHIQNIKSLEFIFQITDGGANTILSILASRGIIYFYDIDKNIIISELNANLEIFKFRILRNGILMACILCSGEVNVFDVTQYIGAPLKTTVIRAVPRDKRKEMDRRQAKAGMVKKQASPLFVYLFFYSFFSLFFDIFFLKFWQSYLCRLTIIGSRTTSNLIYLNEHFFCKRL